jgi:predicted permease
MPRVPRRSPRWSSRAFRALLALYPAAFRDEYGRELSLVFVDRYRDAGSTWERARLWLDALTGILTEAPKEHQRMILQDLRYASRSLRQHAVVTATIVVTLGLGIGANTAVFSLLNTVMLRTLPLPQANELFTVTEEATSRARFSGPTFDRLREAAPHGVGVAAMSRGVARVYTRTGDERGTTPASLQLVSPNFFPVLGVDASIGRLLPADSSDMASDEPVAVISHAYWQRRFAGSPDVVGEAVSINGATFTVVGVGPKEFVSVWLELPVDIWVPLTTHAAVKYAQDYSADGVDFSRPFMSQEGMRWLHIVVRVPQEQLAATAGAFNGAVSGVAGLDAGVSLAPFGRGFSQLRGPFSTPLVALAAMAALVLCIACANVANLLLARATTRQREFAVRAALGAGRGRLIHQLMAENVLLVMMAGGAAVLFARWAGSIFVRMATTVIDGPPPFAATIDVYVFAFAAGTSCAAVALFGVVPAVRATRIDFVSALRSGGRGSTGAGARPARALVVLQVALSLLLVTGTGLLVQSFRNLMDVDLGFDRARVLSIGIDPRLADTTPERTPELYNRVLTAAMAVPGVQSASLAQCGLHSGCRASQDDIEIVGYQTRADERIVFIVNTVSPAYFSTLGMRVTAGRAFTESDRNDGARVAVVNMALATKYFPDGQAVGRRFREGTRDIDIVGIVEDARLLNTKDSAVPAVFYPLSQRPVAARSLDVRTVGDPSPVAHGLRQALGLATPELPIEGITPLEERVQRRLGPERLVVVLTSAFGALALGLAGFGLFGVLSYAVARRTSEFGLRMALGAQQGQIIRGVVRDALWLVTGGIVLGMPLIVIGGRLAAALFFGVDPYDPATIAFAVVVLVCVGGACSAQPAWRASRISPMVALRQD